ncbi:hypothetical protein E2C01_080884 [Portunus trituberculatus]|uniref:Uncharacterized protein n=1 Tax=Portunus trituberculatus TaxID=210409 RepID=A0A5B7IQI6_PORTR|nr:hypothetical protein [Portunus trituberculatus]
MGRVVGLLKATDGHAELANEVTPPMKPNKRTTLMLRVNKDLYRTPRRRRSDSSSSATTR